MCVYHIRACCCPQRSERGFRSSGAGMIADCVLPYKCSLDPNGLERRFSRFCIDINLFACFSVVGHLVLLLSGYVGSAAAHMHTPALM